MTSDPLEGLRDRLREFTAARNWEQFHNPKNLVMALAGEIGELLAHFQWLTEEEAERVMADPEVAEAVTDELADVTIYLVRLADVLDVDLVDGAVDKVDRNEERYPADANRGRADVPPRT